VLHLAGGLLTFSLALAPLLFPLVGQSGSPLGSRMPGLLLGLLCRRLLHRPAAGLLGSVATFDVRRQIGVLLARILSDVASEDLANAMLDLGDMNPEALHDLDISDVAVAAGASFVTIWVFPCLMSPTDDSARPPGEISPKSDQRFAIPYGERGPRSPLVVMIDAHCANGASPMLKIAEKSFDRSFSCCFVLLQQDPEVSLQLQREIFVPEIRAMFEEIRQNLEATASYASFAERHNIQSAATLTVTDAEVAASIAQRLEDRIRGKTVVEIGGGWGLLSLYMGAVARRVYCIEANPMWSMIFTQLLLEIKPKNVSFVFGAADEFVGCIKADIAVICTHSDVSGMKLVGRQLANEIIDVYGEMIDADPEAFDPIARKLRSLT